MAERKSEKRQPSFIRLERRRQRVEERAEEEAERPEEPAPERRPERRERVGAREGEPADVHTRIVIPRQQRRDVLAERRSDADVELREVRYGATSRGPYLRIVPHERQFTKVEAGYIEATALGSRPRDLAGRYWADVRRVVIGSPFATSQAIRERLIKIKALAILGSDPLSSSAYATEEMLIILALAGSGALTNALPIAAIIALLLVIVTLSYRQTIRAYPGGGGAYTVARENLGDGPGLAAAAALLVDYVLLVSVSVAAGVAAITSAVPELFDLRIFIAVAVVAFLTVGNLRGIRESGTLFAAPTYFFLVAMATMIIAGLVKVVIGDAPGSLLDAPPPREQVAATEGLSLFLILRAFSSGGAALTGVEAMSNGVPTFKQPESANARATLTVMAGMAVFLFLGVTFLSSRYGLVPSEQETIVSMLGREVLGGGGLYYAYQVATAMVLLLAANTSYNAFPLLSAVLARDGFMPRQFSFKGDRLAFSNGILVLAGAAALLVIVFNGEVTRLIPLYATGVFVSFTLSQSGMVRHWLRFREPGWLRSLSINGVGAVTTAVVAVIIASTKFIHGAWISILMMLIMVMVFYLIHRHYRGVEEELRIEGEEPEGPEATAKASLTVTVAKEKPSQQHVVVPVDGLNKLTLSAVAFARELSDRVTAIHITDDREEAEGFRKRWEEAVPDVPLLVIESPYRAFVAPVLAYVEHLERAEPDLGITFVLPDVVTRHWLERVLHNQDVLRLKPHLEKRTRVRVVDFQFRLAEKQPVA